MEQLEFNFETKLEVKRTELEEAELKDKKRVYPAHTSFPEYYPSRAEEERRRQNQFNQWHTGRSQLGYEEEERRRRNAYNKWYG